MEEETIQIVATSIYREAESLKDWQIYKVEKNYEERRFFLYPNPNGQYKDRVASINIKAKHYEKAFQNADWTYFDNEYDTALTFDWV